MMWPLCMLVVSALWRLLAFRHLMNSTPADGDSEDMNRFESSLSYKLHITLN